MAWALRSDEMQLQTQKKPTEREMATEVFKECCQAVSADQRVREVLSITDEYLQVLVNGKQHRILTTPSTRVVLIGFGKAVIKMATAAERILGPRLHHGLIITPHIKATRQSGPIRLRSLIFFAAENNLPDELSLAATNFVIDDLRCHDSADTIFLFLISGGGSALLCSPDHSITLKEKLDVIRILTSHGADIHQLNTVRRQLSNVKGGKLLRFIPKSQALSLIVSDVIGDPVELIASGPTVFKPTQLTASDVVDELGVAHLLPDAALRLIHAPPTPSPSTPTVPHFIIGNNRIALQSAKEHLADHGYHPYVVTSTLTGNATDVGRRMATIISSTPRTIDAALAENFPDSELATTSTSDIAFPAALLFGGETTVVIRGPGTGGRNQEMVLACLDSLLQLSQPPPYTFAFLSAGTDGQDGPTDAAGAVITAHDLLFRYVVDTKTHLESSNSYKFWSNYNQGKNHLKIDPTGTNVMDVQILLLKLND